MIITGAGTDATGAGNLVLQVGQANGSITDSETIGVITFGDTSGYSYANILAYADLAAGSDSPGRLVFLTTADGASSATERMRITSDGNVSIQNDSGKFTAGASDDLQIYHTGSYSTIDNNTASLYIRNNVDNDDGGDIYIQAKSGENSIICYDDSHVELLYDGSKKIETTSVGVTVTGSVSDSKGDVRSIIQNTQGSTYTLVAADAGKHILASGTVTIPNSVFSAGDAVTIVNNTASDLTITKTITTMYMSSDATSANRTLATRGMATILFASGTVAYISGAGLS